MIGVKQLSKPILSYCSLHTLEQIPAKWKVNHDISSSSPNAAYTRQRNGLALFQIMACRLFGTKLLPKPMQTYCQLDPQEQTSVKLEPKYEVFHSWKCIWKDRLRNGGHLFRGRWVSIFMEGCDISMFILVIIRIGCSHSFCDFHSLTHLCCDKMAVVLHMIFSIAFID